MRKFWKSIVFKSLAGFAIMIFALCLIITGIGYEEFNKAALEQYEEGALRTAVTAELSFPPDQLNELLEKEPGSEEYDQVYNELDKLCNSTGSTFIYVIQPNLRDYDHITFLYSTIDHTSDYEMYPYKYLRKTTNEEYKEKYAKLYEGKSDHEYVIRNQGYIETDAHITAMIPLKDDYHYTRAILCVQRQMDVLDAVREQYIRKVFYTVALLELFVLVAVALYESRVLLRPLRIITDEAKRYATFNTRPKKKLSDTIRHEDEIGELAKSIDQMEEQINTYVLELTQATIEKERVSTELHLANRIQERMLPTSPPENDKFDIFASMNPAKEVGGDFYDYAMIDEDHLYMCIADVSGKGVPAALLMMATRIVLLDHIMTGKSPAEVLQQANMILCSNNPENMFVTVWMGVLELSTGILTAANAGHEYPALTNHHGEFELYKEKHGIALGAFDQPTYSEYQVQFSPGDKLFVYTDGVPETTNHEKKMFGTKRMLDTLNENREKPMKEILENMTDAAGQFSEDAIQFDDFTMLGMEYLGGGRKR